MSSITLIATLITSSLLAVLGAFLFTRNRRSELNLSSTLMCISASIWLFAYSRAYGQTTVEDAVFWFKIGYSGVIFIAITYFHFSMSFLKVRWIRGVILANYFVGMLLAFLFSNTNYFIEGLHHYFWGYYPKAGSYHFVFLIYFFGLVNASLGPLAYCYFLKRSNFSSLQQQQLKYLLLAMSIFCVASVDFIPNYGIEIYPFGFIPSTIFIAIISYSIVKYRLMNITIAVTRTTIFIAVYSLVLGIPFAIALTSQERLHNLLGDSWWLVPMASLTVLATAGPFLYLFIQKRAEDRLLNEQRRYQATLSQASSGMGRIKDLKRLLALIVYVVTRAVRLEHSSVYVFDENKSKYILGAYKRNTEKELAPDIKKDAFLVNYLVKMRQPIVYEESKQRMQDYNDPQFAKIEEALRELDAAVIVPSLIEDRLLAILVLGKKKSGKLYGEDDLSVFTILANQAALAIENAQFYEDVKKTQEQLFQAEKMATIGTMADGLSHQINNRLHALGFIAGDALDTVKMKKDVQMSDEMKEVMTDLERSLVRIQENVVQGGEIVQGLLRYTRKGEEGFAPVEIDRLVTAALEMAQFKIKTHELKIIREYDLNGPKIKGNFTQLQEVFFNMIDNAYDAMMQRKNEMKEPGFQPTLRILSEVEGDRIHIKFVDNGIGVKAEDFQKIFTPFFTTKLSSKKGTGLGLYVIKKIVDDNHKGKVTFQSKYMEGTTMKLDLPIAVG